MGVIIALYYNHSIIGPIRHFIKNLYQITQQVGVASNELAAASQQLAQGSSQQASAIEETLATFEETAAMLQQNNANTMQAAQLSEQAQGAAAAEQLCTQTDNMKKLMHDLAELVIGKSDTF